jgi:Tol biopolymer transport system component
MKKNFLLGLIIFLLMGCAPASGQKMTSGIINGDLPAIRFAVSPDQKSVAVCAFDQNTIWNISLGNTNRKKISAPEGCNKQYAWRPNSQQIFYIQEIPAGTGQGAIISRDITSDKDTTVVAGEVSNFIFSQDGETIAYHLKKEDGSSELWIMNLTNSNSSKIAQGNMDLVGWSPDGKDILYRTLILKPDYRISGGDLRLYDLNSKKSQKITDEFDQIATVLYSPDGQWVAVSAIKDSGNSLNVFLINTTDFSLKSLTEPGTPDFYPVAWSPQGDELLYELVNKTGPGELRKYTISNGADISIAKVTINSAFWSPDDNKIAYIQDENLLLMSSEGQQTQTLAANVAQYDLLPSFQWLSAKEYVYMDAKGVLHLDSLPD